MRHKKHRVMINKIYQEQGATGWPRSKCYHQLLGPQHITPCIATFSKNLLSFSWQGVVSDARRKNIPWVLALTPKLTCVSLLETDRCASPSMFKMLLKPSKCESVQVNQVNFLPLQSHKKACCVCLSFTWARLFALVWSNMGITDDTHSFSQT